VRPIRYATSGAFVRAPLSCAATRATSSSVASVAASSSSDSRVTPEASASASAARESQASTGGDSVTGVLLVGGASRRFGSPKALARLGGETLAERAWRSLAWCEERLGVGKAGALELPFPVLDDGTDDHAPIFGLRAALAAARHELCLVLPVDAPLVTEEALRTLVRERAVPQTGPLPGVYLRSQLPDVEARIERGELTLRGLARRAVTLDERLLANVNTPADLAALEHVAKPRK
jgi:molybdopterin-guanine dinucleotide biosynthesis protein A